MARHYKRYTILQVREAIRDSVSWRQAAFKLGLNGDAGSNNKTLKKIAEENKFDYSHFKGQRWGQGKAAHNRIPIENWLKKGVIVKSGHLKKRLLREKMIDKACSICGNEGIWNGKSLTLQLDHIDGDGLNNMLENLRLVCPNCHSQTKTFCRSNGKK